MAETIDLDPDAAGGDEREPEEAPERPKRSRARDAGRKRSGQRRPPQEARIRESLEAIGHWLRERGDDELGGTLERDAPKMARVLGDLTRVHPLAKTVVAILADVLEPVRAFGPTLLILRRRAAGWFAGPEELPFEPGEELLTEPVPVAAPEPEIAEPWRIAE